MMNRLSRSTILKRVATGLVGAALVASAGCSSLMEALPGGGVRTRQGQSSSLVAFLYPKGETPPPVDATVPTLKLPLRVGLAFVPAANRASSLALPEALKNELLEQVRAEFKGEKFLSEITVVPDSYLAGRAGFTALDGIARLYSLDVIALVSYDQASTSADTRASLLYWTIVGAYIVKGTRNEVQTFVDTAVFDVPTHRLLFRAPGLDRRERDTTMVTSADDLRIAQQESFRSAMHDMTANLRKELVAFEGRIKSDGTVRVAQKSPGNGGGGGAMGVAELGLLAALAGLARARRRVRSADGAHR
jgi:rhombotail lipoprotein